MKKTIKTKKVTNTKRGNKTTIPDIVEFIPADLSKDLQELSNLNSSKKALKELNKKYNIDAKYDGGKVKHKDPETSHIITQALQREGLVNSMTDVIDSIRFAAGVYKKKMDDLSKEVSSDEHEVPEMFMKLLQNGVLILDIIRKVVKTYDDIPNMENFLKFKSTTSKKNSELSDKDKESALKEMINDYHKILLEKKK